MLKAESDTSYWELEGARKRKQQRMNEGARDLLNRVNALLAMAHSAPMDLYDSVCAVRYAANRLVADITDGGCDD